MYLHQITVDNYSIHRSSKLTLYPLSVLVGPCGGGKSALFDALINFSLVARGRLREAFDYWPNSFEAKRFHGAKSTDLIGYDVVLSQSKEDTTRLGYCVSYEQVDDPDRNQGDAQYKIHDERLERRSLISNQPQVLFDRAPRKCDPSLNSTQGLFSQDRSILSAIRTAATRTQDAPIAPDLVHIAENISRIAKFRLDPSELRRAGQMPDTAVVKGGEGRSPRIRYAGEELASLLKYWDESEDPAIERVGARLQSVIPEFKGFEFNAASNGRVGFSARYNDLRQLVPAANLSDGTLILIGLFSLLESPQRPPILLLEEPENGLNPPAIRAVYEAMKDATAPSQEFPCQIVFSSHSPLVLMDTWNGEDKEFIYQVQPVDGASTVIPMQQTISPTTLSSRKGLRDHLTFNHACDILGGRPVV